MVWKFQGFCKLKRKKVDMKILEKALADTAERLVSLRLNLHRDSFGII